MSNWGIKNVGQGQGAPGSNKGNENENQGFVGNKFAKGRNVIVLKIHAERGKEGAKDFELKIPEDAPIMEFAQKVSQQTGIEQDRMVVTGGGAQIHIKDQKSNGKTIKDFNFEDGATIKIMVGH